MRLRLSINWLGLRRPVYRLAGLIDLQYAQKATWSSEVIFQEEKNYKTCEAVADFLARPYIAAVACLAQV